VRADEFLAARRIAVRETADARKERFEKHDLRELFKGARRVIAIKAKKRVEFDLAREVDLEALAEAVIGPTGGLRAPTLLVGDAALVGFGPEHWAEFFDAQ
jgi:arsenate reductase-like glutaredoxin family protein